ncbi:MAG: EAL domain-containing protein [Gallionellaceae bacterium]|jgi:diguanylate cyclase (GGDEF)-like protein/PAS domain S-box-containing protein
MLSINTKQSNSQLVSKLSVLFVEDDADVRDSMASYLSRRVAQVHTAHNGEAGLSTFNELHPDLVISDIRMGEMDGLAMCRAIREKSPNQPVIFISAHNESDILLSSIDLGVTKFIVKPVDTGILMETIGNVANMLEEQRDIASQMQHITSILHESDYEKDCVKNYVARYLESNHHDEIAELRHLNIPKLEVSGDFYCVAQHQDDLYVMLVDGAGHGLSAVLPALHIPRIFQQDAEKGYSLLTIAAELNHSLFSENITGHFAATTFIRCNPHEQFIEVLNCGNPGTLIFDEAGKLLHAATSKTTALGMVTQSEFSAELERFKVDKNARIYLFTDGLLDTLQAENPEFNEAALQAMLGNAAEPAQADLNSGELSENEPAMSGVCGFDAVANKVQAVPPHCKVDDVTLLEIQFDCERASMQIELPLEAASNHDEVEEAVDLSKMTLLYVEDDDLTRDYLALYLNRRIGMVYVAKDGREGLALFKKHRPQIVLSDIQMPHMTGLDMAEEIRKLDKFVPIIVTSGSDNAEDAERMFDMGISRFHMKPLDPAKLTQTIQSCIRQSEVLSRLHLSASAFQASSLAVVTADQDRHIVAVNEAFTRNTGFSLAEVMGNNPVMLSSGKLSVDQHQDMWRTLEAQGSWSGELQCQHKNGESVFEWVTVNAVKNFQGGVTGYHFIFSDISERKMNEEKTLQLTLHDSLTQLPNRTMLKSKLNERLEQAKQRMENLALAYINIDHFTEINNALGVRVGDEVLYEIAQRILANVNMGDGVFSMGGDEFAVLIGHDGDKEVIRKAIEKISSAIRQPIEIRGQAFHLRESIGVGLYPADGENCEQLLKSAGSAMTHAQRSGGNTYRFYDRSLSQRDERHVLLQQGMKPGLKNNEFYMVYQPKYSLGRQRVVGAEALLRWVHPSLGPISPVEFIPLAESSGVVIEMTDWIIDTVCAQLADWRRRGIEQVPVSINISPLHFTRGDLVLSLVKALNKWDISPALLPIEVTEGVVMDASDTVMRILRELKAMGFHLSIDDFGTGYSSLKYLREMPVSELKIDRSFIIGIPEEGENMDASATTIVRTIILLAADFNLTVVAEGVETEHQKNFLQANDCDVIQGFWFSKPVAADDFAVLLK